MTCEIRRAYFKKKINTAFKKSLQPLYTSSIEIVKYIQTTASHLMHPITPPPNCKLCAAPSLSKHLLLDKCSLKVDERCHCGSMR